MVYAAANGLYAAALNFGPLSLLACVFTLLLVFNMGFARWLLGEALTPPKVSGCLMILVGVCLCVIGAARDAPTKFTADEIEDLFVRPAGMLYLIVIVCIVLMSVFTIMWYEWHYPAAGAVVDIEHGGRADTALEGPAPTPKSDEPTAGAVTTPMAEGSSAEDDNGSTPTPVEPFQPGDCSPASRGPSCCGPSPKSGAKEVQKTMVSEDGKLACRRAGPSVLLDRFMGLVYPGSLGLDEGIAHLTMKGTMAMMSACGGICSHWVFFVFLSLWIAASVATAWWLKVVFARYETTLALPVEYGMVNVASVCSGLIFYNEMKYMEAWQVVLSIAGLAIILSGIQCSRQRTTCK